jgi:hypothetical protein
MLHLFHGLVTLRGERFEKKKIGSKTAETILPHERFTFC